MICEKTDIDDVRKLVHKIGTTGDVADHYFTVKDTDEEDKMFLLNVSEEKIK